MKTLALGLVAVLFASSALDNPATVQGADHLTQVFQTYFGAGAQAINVVAHGALCDLTLHPKPLIAQASGKGDAMTYEGPIGLRMQAPAGKASVSLTVADALTAVPNTAPADRKVQALTGFVLAQGLAMAEGDKLVCQIDTATHRALSIKTIALIEQVRL